MARNRIIYGSQSVWVNGEIMYRVQTLGSTTTFTSEDIFELGHLDIVDIVDDVPAVAVTLNTNDWGDVKTMAVLAQVASAKLVMEGTPADDTTGNLATVSGASATEKFYHHGVPLQILLLPAVIYPVFLCGLRFSLSVILVHWPIILIRLCLWTKYS